MQEQYRIYQRGGKNFYAKDTKTGRAFSLNTSDEHEAKRLVTAKNQSTEQPCLNVAMARVYLSAQSPEFTNARGASWCRKVMKSRPPCVG
jgi:hypothetical protein